MKIEQAKELAVKALGQLAEALEQGRSSELSKYLAAMAKFPRYSLNNLLLILAQRPDTARVAGYGTWRELGRQVIAQPVTALRDDRRLGKGFRALAAIETEGQDAQYRHEQHRGDGERHQHLDEGEAVTAS